MWALEKAIALKYPVPQISGDSLAVRMTRGDSTLLVFDTRPVEEYDVSRLRDAIIDPDLGVEEFIDAYGEGLSGRDLIFYCSVGYRSSDVVQRVIRAAQERGARSVSNLRGGLFRWYIRRPTALSRCAGRHRASLRRPVGSFPAKKAAE